MAATALTNMANANASVSEDHEERELNGAEKASIILLALGDEHGGPIWSRLGRHRDQAGFNSHVQAWRDYTEHAGQPDH